MPLRPRPGAHRRATAPVALTLLLSALPAARAARAQTHETSGAMADMPGMAHGATPRAAAHAHAAAPPVSSRGDTKPEPAWRALQRRQLAEVRAATARYQDLDAAKADGFARFPGDEVPLMGEHWYRKNAPEAPPGTPADAQVDLARPSVLQYARVGGKPVLVGVAYSLRLAPGEPLPEGFAGPEDRWHQHDALAFFDAATEDRPFLRWIGNRWLDGTYRKRGDGRTLITMVHAWVWLDNPDGAFAEEHRVLPYLRAGLPAAWADAAAGGDRDAALGVALLPADGCKQLTAGDLWIANASKAQRRLVEGACRDARSRVSAAVSASADPRVVNAEADSAWRALEAARAAALSARQQARIDATKAHAGMGAQHGMDGHDTGAHAGPTGPR